MEEHTHRIDFVKGDAQSHAVAMNQVLDTILEQEELGLSFAHRMEVCAHFMMVQCYACATGLKTGPTDLGEAVEYTRELMNDITKELIDGFMSGLKQAGKYEAKNVRFKEVRAEVRKSEAEDDHGSH